ncbi:class I SAM-dependent methyltransferase [Streptomyces sp. NPDC004647]|uniref:O-methyltransferase n=1 Tax=Streptomyces sp. NPDC004647 TaxID=3154671 RepID=UPI0033A98EC1
MTELPHLVSEALKSAADHDFPLSCEPLVGRLLSTLSAAVPPGGRILELGTGVGVGTAWLVEGVLSRSDVTVVTVESSPDLSAPARRLPWPEWVELRTGDAVELLPTLGGFDLIFADAEGGKWERLDLTVSALQASGILVVDDMDVTRYQRSEHRATVSEVRDAIVSHPRLTSVELPVASGIIIGTKRHV